MKNQIPADLAECARVLRVLTQDQPEGGESYKYCRHRKRVDRKKGWDRLTETTSFRISRQISFTNWGSLIFDFSEVWKQWKIFFYKQWGRVNVNLAPVFDIWWLWSGEPLDGHDLDVDNFLTGMAAQIWWSRWSDGLDGSPSRRCLAR